VARHRKPAEIRRLDGTEVRGAPTISAAGSPYPLHELSDEGRLLFFAILAAMPPNLYTAADTQALGNYCHQCVLHHRMIAETNEPDFAMLLATERGMVINPLLRQIRQSALTIASLGARLGLDPVTRQNIKADFRDPNMPRKFAGLLNGRITDKSTDESLN
jgi:hypothetical protein